MTTPPGWYPDQSGTVRWFDGYRWTDAVNEPLPPKKPLALWIPTTFLAVGLALIVWASTLGLPHPLSVFRGPHLSAPGSATVHLDEGPWVVYEESPSGVPEVGQTITAADVTVDGTSGTVTAYGSETVTLGARRYVSVARFDAIGSGAHEISIASHDQGQRDVFISRPITYAFRGIRGLVVGIGGGLFAMVGVALLIFSLSRRKSAAKG